MMMDEERRRRSGAFYTPPLWADKAMERVSAAVPRPGYRWNRGAMVFYDPAAGEGALLDAVVRRYGGCCLTPGFDLLADQSVATGCKAVLNTMASVDTWVFAREKAERLNKTD